MILKLLGIDKGGYECGILEFSLQNNNGYCMLNHISVRMGTRHLDKDDSIGLKFTFTDAMVEDICLAVWYYVR